MHLKKPCSISQLIQQQVGCIIRAFATKQPREHTYVPSNGIQMFLILTSLLNSARRLGLRRRVLRMLSTSLLDKAVFVETRILSIQQEVVARLPKFITDS